MRLVRAFNAINYKSLQSEAHRAGEPVAIPLAGDDSQALAVASQLVKDAGFEPVVVGPLSSAKLYYGSVVVHVHGSPQLEGKPYLSCAYMQLYYRGYTVQAAVLLDARHPGQLPALLPDSVVLGSQPETVNEPQRSTQQPITGRRIGDAWLVVESIDREGSSALAERLAVLKKLIVCVRLHGTLCP